jgi:putative transposase
MACVDRLKGFPEAINTVFPQTLIPFCSVPMVRNSLKYVVWKDYKAVTSDLKLAVQAASKPCTMPMRNWKLAMNRFIIEFEDRLAQYI